MQLADGQDQSSMLNTRIIYVEDNPDDVLILERALRQAKHTGTLVHLADVAAAKDFFKQCAEGGSRPGVILVDLHIGADSGKDLIQYIRTFERFRDVPVVTLSGSYVFEDLDKAYETGANLFLIKPSDPNGWTDLVF